MEKNIRKIEFHRTFVGWTKQAEYVVSIIVFESIAFGMLSGLLDFDWKYCVYMILFLSLMMSAFLIVLNLSTGVYLYFGNNLSFGGRRQDEIYGVGWYSLLCVIELSIAILVELKIVGACVSDSIWTVAGFFLWLAGLGLIGFFIRIRCGNGIASLYAFAAVILYAIICVVIVLLQKSTIEISDNGDTIVTVIKSLNKIGIYWCLTGFVIYIVGFILAKKASQEFIVEM